MKPVIILLRENFKTFPSSTQLPFVCICERTFYCILILFYAFSLLLTLELYLRDSRSRKLNIKSVNACELIKLSRELSTLP